MLLTNGGQRRQRGKAPGIEVNPHLHSGHCAGVTVVWSDRTEMRRQSCTMVLSHNGGAEKPGSYEAVR